MPMDPDVWDICIQVGSTDELIRITSLLTLNFSILIGHRLLIHFIQQ